MFVHRRVPKRDAGPEACGHRQGEGRAEVRKSDRQPARVLRDVAFAVANQALKGPEAIPEGVSPSVQCPSGTANSSPSPASLATPVPRRARNTVHAGRATAPKRGSARLTEVSA